MFHLSPLSWFVPSSVGFLPHLSLAVVVKVVALAFNICSPVAVAMLCKQRLVLPYTTVSLAVSILARMKPGSL
ncbi:hypothetical protein GQ42DRAFT_166124 [Ramicandelaber brevisporus]|nr:hypothetical protein GQ42DRAFT_166124 [Ramicandelaber brevisporus]